MLIFFKVVIGKGTIHIYVNPNNWRWFLKWRVAKTFFFLSTKFLGYNSKFVVNFSKILIRKKNLKRKFSIRNKNRISLAHTTTATTTWPCFPPQNMLLLHLDAEALTFFVLLLVVAKLKNWRGPSSSIKSHWQCLLDIPTLSQRKLIFRDLTWNVAGKTWYYAE